MSQSALVSGHSCYHHFLSLPYGE